MKKHCSDHISVQKPEDRIHLVLAGQPNCGKSTIFNEVAGYRSIASNFPGATVSYSKGSVNIQNQTCEIIDLPGIYSLTSLDPAARESQNYLLSKKVDVIVNVLDASILSRSLELTLQLLELEIPMVLCLNMADEAERKGIFINIKKLSKKLGIPVVNTIASKGKGIMELMEEALKTAQKGETGAHIAGNQDVETIISQVMDILKASPVQTKTSPHLLATKFLEYDPYFESLVRVESPSTLEKLNGLRHQMEEVHGRSADEIINHERHGLSMSIFEEVATLKKPRVDWKDKADDLLMHKVWGYVILFGVLFLFFYLVFKLGALIEEPLLATFDSLGKALYGSWNPDSLLTTTVKGMFDGISGGIAIVIPYLLPFLLGLSFLEDAGYLPRVAFLMDSFMHRIGLHGTAVIPMVLGYGCNVPAVMAVRILDSPRDRMIAAFLASMVPCAARMTIILGLVGYLIGGTAAFLIYVFNFVIIAFSGVILSKLMPEATPGMMLEIPKYQIPGVQTVFRKTWFRLKEFIVIAWPLLIAGSAILSLAEYFNWMPLFNRLISPITGLLGLPVQTGTTLIFGVLRKELSMLMLYQALGTHDLLSVLTYSQILVFTIFVVFYVPCVATLGVLYKQIRLKGTLAVLGLTFLLALVLGMLTRVVSLLFW